MISAKQWGAPAAGGMVGLIAALMSPMPPTVVLKIRVSLVRFRDWPPESPEKPSRKGWLFCISDPVRMAGRGGERCRPGAGLPSPGARGAGLGGSVRRQKAGPPGPAFCCFTVASVFDPGFLQVPQKRAVIGRAREGGGGDAAPKCVARVPLLLIGENGDRLGGEHQFEVDNRDVQ